MSFQVIMTPEFERSVERQASQIMESRLTEIRAEIIDEFNAPKSGREYQISRGVTYRASAPGEPPAVRTGALRASVGQPHVGRSGRFLVGTLEITAPYAGYLERGTPRIKPRPFAMPAVEKVLRRRA